METPLPAHVLTERRALIQAVDQASAELHSAAREVSDDMGLIGPEGREYVVAQRATYKDAQAALEAFYARYPLKTYRKQFAAESRAYRGRS